MPVHELAQLTWEEVRDLDREHTLVVLPVGAIEAHGPHLPLDTDVVIATAMARAGARRLAAPGGGGAPPPRFPPPSGYPRPILRPGFPGPFPPPALPRPHFAPSSRARGHTQGHAP